MKTILALFPSRILYGKERSNYEVFRILNNNTQFSLSIIANKNASAELKKMLHEFETSFITFPSRIGKFRIFKYFCSYVYVNMYMFFYLLRNKVDCIYLNDEMSIFDFFPTLLLTKAKLIYRIGDAPAFPTLTGYKINSFVWNKIINKKVSTIVSISNFIKSEIYKYGRSSINDCVIYNIPPSRKIKNDDKLSFKSDSSLVLGYLGRIDNIKGVHILIDSVISMLNKNKDITLYLAGDISVCPDYYKDLHIKILNSGYEKQIRFLGELNNVDSFFCNIDILCVPTIVQEALGNVVVEAKLNRTPVVVFPSGGMPEIIEHGVDGYVCSEKTAEAIENIIDLYYSDRSLVKLHSENSYISLKKLGIKYELFREKWNNVFIKTLQ